MTAAIWSWPEQLAFFFLCLVYLVPFVLALAVPLDA